MKKVRLFKQHSDYLEFTANTGEFILSNVSKCKKEHDIHLVPKYQHATSVTLNKTSISFFVGDTETLVATVHPDNAADKTVTWTTSNPNVVTVSSEGLVTAVASGTAFVTATANGGACFDICTVTSERDFSREYLSFTALEDGRFKLSGNQVSYSVNSGETWTNLNSNTYTPTISSGSTIMFKGNLTNPRTTGDVEPKSATTAGIGKFVSTGAFNAEGNPLSLVYGDDFVGKPLKDFVFANLFHGCSHLVNSEHLYLGALDTASYCYVNMFSGCTNMVTAPDLPATSITSYCYGSMFTDCKSLVNYTYQLPATAIAKGCYYGMFERCSALTNVFESLYATTLYENCYRAMLAETAIERAPALPALTLVTNCYRYMFNKCLRLTYIKALFLTTPSDSYTMNFTANVPNVSTSVFVKHTNATWTNTGSNAVPSNWTIERASS